MSQSTQAGVRPWMFFTGLAVMSMVILFSTGKLEQLRPLSQQEKADLLLAQSEKLLYNPASWNSSADPVRYDQAVRTIERIEGRKGRD